jgi:hypothetical protein
MMRIEQFNEYLSNRSFKYYNVLIRKYHIIIASYRGMEICLHVYVNFALDGHANCFTCRERDHGTINAVEHTYSLKLTITQLIKEFPNLYKTWRLITLFTRAGHWSVASTRWIYSIPSYISLRSILMLFLSKTQLLQINCKKWLLALSCLSIRPHGTERPTPDRFWWNFVFGFLLKLVDTFRFWLVSDKNNLPELLRTVVISRCNWSL